MRGGRVTVSGPGEAGVFYGTRTLKQEMSGTGAAPEGVVRDEPAKPRRGMMLDIARKHYGAGWIEDRIRELGDLKYNEIGLHFSDDQGFRIESDSHPEIVSKDHLTKAQVQKIVDLAESRHITVVPEIDSPGHLGAVIDAHPDLQLRKTNGEAVRGAVDIANPKSAQIVDDLLDEYAGLFPATSGTSAATSTRPSSSPTPRRPSPASPPRPATSTAPAPPSRTSPPAGSTTAPPPSAPTTASPAPGTTASSPAGPSRPTRTSGSPTGPARRSAPASPPSTWPRAARSSTTTTSSSTTSSASR